MSLLDPLLLALLTLLAPVTGGPPSFGGGEVGGGGEGGGGGGAVGAVPGADELPLRLAELSSPSAEVRARAERWLAVHVGRRDFPDLADTVLAGDAEVRRRVARVVGAEERQLALALDFLGEDAPVLREVGETAIQEMLARWSSDYGTRPVADRGRLQRVLLDLLDDGRPTHLRVDVAAPLEELVDLLARRADLPVGLVVEPRLRRAVGERLAPEPVFVVGTWDQILVQVADLRGIGLEAMGADPLGEPGGGVVMRFTAPGDEGRTPAVDTLVRWCREVVSPAGRNPGARGSGGRQAAAVALVRTGWPAAIAWLEERWRRDGDEEAREAVLVAAALGRRVPSLATRAGVEEVLQLGRARVRAGDAGGAARCLNALGAGVCRDGEGAPLSALLLEGWDAYGPAERTFVLAVLEATACPLGEAELAPCAALLRAAPGTHGPLLLRQALRTWVACGGAELGPLGAPLDLLSGPSPGSSAGTIQGGASGAWVPEERRELVRLLLRAGVPPPPGAPEPGALPGEVQAALLEWRLGAGELDAAAEGLLAGDLLAADSTTAGHPGSREAAALLAAWVERGDGPRVLDLLERARGRAPDAPDAPDAAGRRALDRLALLAGALDPAEHGPFLAEALGPDGPEVAGDEDLELLGALAGAAEGEAGDPARNALLGRLVHDLEAKTELEELLPVLRAVEGAIGRLLSRGADGLADGLRSEASGRVLFDGRGSPAYGMLRALDWPPFPPPRRVISPALAERELPL